MHAAVLTLALIAALPAAAQELRTDIHYRLSTELRGPDQALGVVNGGRLDGAAALEPVANVSSQYWRVTLGAGGTVRLTSMFRGPEVCLSAIPEGEDRAGEATLRPCAEAPGQRWRPEADGTRFRLIAAGLPGRPQCLEVIADGEAAGRLRLGLCGFWASQFWTFAPTDQPVN
ncbi:MAG TPA: hypothetical protein VLA78_05955 [Paracoccaceae bacterium]|nr:hypothetical protein [Paracoccaceae bacterium]